MREYFYHEKQYDVDVLFIFGGTLRDIAKKYGEAFLDEETKNNEYTITGRCTSYSMMSRFSLPFQEAKKSMLFIVWVKNDNEPHILVHEITHLVAQISTLKKLNFQLDQSEQMAAYAGEWFEVAYSKYMDQGIMQSSNHSEITKKFRISFFEVFLYIGSLYLSLLANDTKIVIAVGFMDIIWMLYGISKLL